MEVGGVVVLPLLNVTLPSISIQNSNSTQLPDP